MTTSTALAPIASNLISLTGSLSKMLNISGADSGELLDTLKLTAFKGDGTTKPTDAQLASLLIVAQQYRLNPWVKEIFAFPDKRGGIVPVVSVDGWMRIINENPQFDGIEFAVDWLKGDESVTCTIFRKDRSHPTKVTEYLVECLRGTDPWRSHPRRMLRHKASIQCARIAFGYAGIYDQDEAERILANQQPPRDMGPADVVQPQQTPAATAAPEALPAYPGEKFEENLPKWRDKIVKGVRSAADYVSWLEQSYTLTKEQRQRIEAPIISSAEVTDVEPKAKSDAAAPTAADPMGKRDAEPGPDAAASTDPRPTYAVVAGKIADAIKGKSADALVLAGDLIRSVENEQHRTELQALFDNAEKTIAAPAK